MCCPANKVIKSNSIRVLPIGGLHEDKLCGTLQAMAPINVKTVHQTSSLRIIESNLDRVRLLSHTHGQRCQQKSGQLVPQSVSINKPKFLKATRHTEIWKMETPRSMVAEALNW